MEDLRLDQLNIYEQLLEHCWDAIIYTDLDGQIIMANAAATELYGYSKEEFIGINAEIFNSHQARDRREIRSTVLKKGRWEGELIQRRKGNSTFTAKLIVWLIRDENGKPAGFGSNRKNISNSTETKSELEASLHEKEVLLAEVHHRVKNNLQLISSLLNLQSSFMTDDSIKETLRDLQSRVRTMSLIHERLYMDDLSRINVREYTEELFDDIVATQQVSTRVSLTLDIEDFELEIQRMIPLGLMLNELITNSLKHAFVGRLSGNISVTLSTASPMHYKMTYSDDGLGFKNNYQTHLSNGSFGSMLIDTFAEQLDGTLKHLVTDKGTTYELQF